MPDPVRRLPVPPLAGLEGQGCGALGSGGPAVQLPHSFPVRSSSIQGFHLSAFVPPLVHQRGGAERLFSSPCGRVRSGASSSAVSRLLQLAVHSLEDLRVLETSHRSLNPQLVRGRGSLLHGDHPVCTAVSSSDWMASIDLKEAYLQVLVHPDSRRFLRFVAQGQVYQFSALCFGLSTAPQVFSRVMAPVSAILRSWGIRMRRYLDDWLVQSSSRDSLLHDLQVVLDLCQELGIVVNPSKSHLVPSRVVQYLGVVIDSRSFRASPSSERVAKLFSTADAFLSCAAPPASTWLRLLGILSSLAHLVPGGRLRVRSLQLCLHRLWDREDMSALIPWSPDCLRDLRWWLDLPRLSLGMSLVQVSPALDFWSDALDVGWGAHLGSLTASGLWDQEQAALSINARELLAVQEGLHHFLPSLTGMAVSIFCDNSTAVSYLRKEGGTRSPFLNTLAQEILRWAESHSIRLLPQFIPGSLNVLADSLSHPHQLPHTEWSLHPEVFRSISRLWPVQIDLFATSANRQCSVFFSPFQDPLAAGTDAFLQCWDGLQAYAFPPWSILPKVLAKLRVSPGLELTLIAPYWPQRPWFANLLHLSLAPPVALPLRRDLLLLPQSHCLYQGLPRLRLHAWRLSGASLGLQVSPQL